MEMKLIIATAVLLYSTAAFAEAKQEDAVAASSWQDTGLTFEFLDERLTTRRCHQSELAFVSCVAAVQRVLDARGSQLRLLPAVASAEANGRARTVKRFSGLTVAKMRGKRFLDEGNALVLLRERTQAILQWRAHYPVSRANPVDFSAVRRWLLAEIVDPERREDFAAAAINGYLSVGDAHSKLVPTDLIRGSMAGRPVKRGSSNESSPTYTGIGASVQGVGEAVIVTNVLRDGPADRSGLRVQDIVLAVDGELVTDLPPASVVGKLRGPEGLGVSVTVKRQDQLKTFMVVRGQVNVKNVYASVFVDRGWEFGYLRIDSFVDGNTCAEAGRGLRRVLKPALNGIVLDLRNNSGGLMDQAACVADLFLPPGEVVLQIKNVEAPENARRLRTRHRQWTEVPLVTLVNAATASAAEMLAGALQDHGRSLVAGERTFGKGTVQTARPWRGSAAVLEMYTAARYYRPSGRGVQLVGIEPDLPIPLPVDGPSTERIVLREEDLFPTALPGETERATPQRSDNLSSLSACVAAEGLADKRRKRSLRERRPADYSLLVAQDQLTCQLRHSAL